MAIKINNDYPEFRITDTLHQLVDRLNGLTGILDSNIRQLDSANGIVLGVVDSSGSGLVADSNLSISAIAGRIEMSADSSIDIHAGTDLTLRADNTVTLDAGDKLFFNTDSGEILLRSQGTQFGALKKVATSNDLGIYSGTDLAVSFDSSNAIFAGVITLPPSGAGSPFTNSKTLHGSINELIQEHDSDQAVTDSRLGVLEPEVTSLRTDLTSLESRTDQLDSFATSQNLLNISNRLATIEGQIVLINDRLDILEIFS